MKFIKYVFLIFFILSSIISCKKKKSEPTENNTPVPTPVPEPVFNKTFSATIDGTVFTPTTIGAVQNMSFIVVSAQKSNDIIQVATQAANDPGTYPVVTGLSMYIKNGQQYSCDSGTIIITQHDKTKKHIYGTFEMTVSNGTDIKNITSGSFATTY